MDHYITSFCHLINLSFWQWLFIWVAGGWKWEAEDEEAGGAEQEYWFITVK